MIKRELGESPRQSRCCEPPLTGANMKPLSVLRVCRGMRSPWEGVRRRAVSQKTCRCKEFHYQASRNAVDDATYFIQSSNIYHAEEITLSCAVGIVYAAVPTREGYGSERQYCTATAVWQTDCNGGDRAGDYVLRPQGNGLHPQFQLQQRPVAPCLQARSGRYVHPDYLRAVRAHRQQQLLSSLYQCV